MFQAHENIFVIVLFTFSSSASEAHHDTAEHFKHINNITYVPDKLAGIASVFSPRMDFDQWKPLTGRGDPLRNDPTYDYEPPVLERVHYWADDARLEREHYPERKSEILMLGITSKKPSVTVRLPPPRRHSQRRPPSPPKYEDFTYKTNEHYPMTILVPPPPPPPGHTPPLFTLLTEEKIVSPNMYTKTIETSTIASKTTSMPSSEHLTSLYSFQEANLIYQSSTSNQNQNIANMQNYTKYSSAYPVSSDYAGWGPTTPIDDSNSYNDDNNVIVHYQKQQSKMPYTFYKPILSEAPPSPTITSSPIEQQTSTILPSVDTESTSITVTEKAWQTEEMTFETTTDNQDFYKSTTTEKSISQFLPTPNTPMQPNSEMSILDMLGPMLSMPLVNGPEREEDNLYAHASTNTQIYKVLKNEDLNIESMQTMQPTSPTKPIENVKDLNKKLYHVHAETSNNIDYKKSKLHTPDPYKYHTTPMSTTQASDKTKATTDFPVVPMYLIIQGHSKVKSYSSKSKPNNNTLSNEIWRPNEINEVKHLHPLKNSKNTEIYTSDKKGKALDLKTLVNDGHGSIEIQETDVGIKYDVSDGSDVPVEIYRKGIVDNDDFKDPKKVKKRTVRQIDLEDILPFDQDNIEEFVYKFLESRKNESSITGLIAQAITSDTATVLDEFEEDTSEQDHEKR